MKLDYSLNTPEERRALVEKILEETPNPNEKYLEYLADYLVFCMEKQEKRERKILTENRLATITKRETSLEGLASQFENGEDGLYDLIVEEDKHTIFKPKISITKKDIEEIPELQQARDAIQYWEERLRTATGRDAYIAKKAIIDFRKDQYIIKDAVKVPVLIKGSIGMKVHPKLEGYITLNEDGFCESHGITLVDSEVCSCIFCNYTLFKTQSAGAFQSDLWSLMFDFDNLLERALQRYPIYQKIVECKLAGFQNLEIQKILLEEFKVNHSVEYISCLWRNKIPQILASQAEDDYLDWYYLEIEKGNYKKCGKCGKIKLAHNKYFSKNVASKDGWYSICKDCRSRRKK